MVKVLVISDEVAPALHVRMLRDLSPDLVLSAGDLPWDYLEYVATAVDAPLVFVPGNHDPALERAKLRRNGTYTVAGLPVDSPAPAGRHQRRPAGGRGGRPPDRRSGRAACATAPEPTSTPSASTSAARVGCSAAPGGAILWTCC